MSEHPILFSGPMVRAILEGRKTQTRRVMKPQPFGGVASVDYHAPSGVWRGVTAGEILLQSWRCPYGVPGDRLYVKERHRLTRFTRGGKLWMRCEYKYEVDSDGGVREFRWKDIPEDSRRRIGKIRTRGKWRPARFMYRFLARIALELTGVRVERVQDISEADAQAEGVYAEGVPTGRYTAEGDAEEAGSYRAAFVEFWDNLNDKRGFGYETGCYVWVNKFKRIEL